MSTRNPTSLRVGMTGELDGRRYTVAGRVVFSTRVHGVIYYWNEFNLVGGYGTALTLVFEEGENGPEWKVFELFEPLRAMTATEAAAKKVGDTVSLDGSTSRVTLVGQSRVVEVEGTAPEGVEQGDVADYWNAENPRSARMLVASWTGGEIEFYKGRTIAASRVAAAFNVPRLTDEGWSSFRGGESQSVSAELSVLIIGSFILLIFGGIPGLMSWSERPPTVAPAAVQPAPALRLNLGAHGMFGGVNYTVAGRMVVEVAGVGGKFGRVEYELVADDSTHARLVQAFDGDAHDWRLLTPVPTPTDLTPYRAPAKCTGDPVALSWRGTFVVRGLYLCRQLSSEGRSGELPTVGGQEAYGFVARNDDETLLARWNETTLSLELGKTVSEKTVLTVLGSSR